jgi:dTDP-4-amino-4,6-dideoxygalactose transaminase
MREVKSIMRLCIFTTIAFLQGLEMILFQKAEVEFIDIEGVPYSLLDREQLEHVYTIEED